MENSKKTKEVQQIKKIEKIIEKEVQRELKENSTEISKQKEVNENKEKAATKKKIDALKVGDRVKIHGSTSVGTIDKIKKEEDTDKEMIRVMATIIVERDSQKGIVIGKRGALLKEVGTRARHDIEMLLGTKVFLELWVKVQKDWRNKSAHLKDYGFREDEY